MKILILTAILFAPFIYATGQNNPYPIKEYYDKLYPTSDYSPANIDYTDCSKVGNSLSWILSSLLRMYETTGDKAYLIKFINHSIQIQNNRRDILTSGDDPVWVRTTDDLCDGQQDDAEPAYFNSLLIYPMSEFVNMVINEPGHTLYNTNLPLQLINNLPSSPTILGYGDFANWLGKKVEETIIFMNYNYWDDSFGIKNHNGDDCFSGSNRTCGTAMNMNSPYGCALLFMGLANTNFGYGNNRADYLYKAQLVASFYKGVIDIVDGCNGNLSYTNYPVIRLMSNENDSYFWYHAGWGLVKEFCVLHPFVPQPKVTGYLEFVEDVSHGAMDLWFIKACYEAQFAPDIYSQPYFTDTEMARFRNTFTKNIYYTDINGGHFHNCVNGTDDQFADNTCAPNCPTDLMYGEALDWMPLYKFDGGTTPNVYDILVQHTTGLIDNSPTTENLTGGQSFLGLSEVVKAQWDKECVNLTLYNRDVVYDQDFIVKNNLIVAPELEDDFHVQDANSFAEPIITDNTFIVESGTTVNMVAGESIRLLPGFSAKAGSNFHAYIDPDLCDENNSRITQTQNVNNTIATTYSSLEKETKIIDSTYFKISPNPTNGDITLSYNFNENTDVFFEIYNSQGVKECSYSLSGSVNSKSISLAPLNNGIYSYRAIAGDKLIATDKIVVIK